MERENCTPYQERLWDHLDAIMVMRMRMPGKWATRKTVQQQRLTRLEDAVMELLRRSYAA